MNDAQAAKLRELAERTDAARNFPANTCPASRHVQMIADMLAARLPHAVEDPEHCAESLYVVVESLWRTRTERDALRRERDEAKRVIDDAYAALGGDAWWMDPPDGGSPTLAEMVAKANEDGRALYDVKRERDAAIREKVLATQTAQRLAEERDAAMALLRSFTADGYIGGTCSSDPDGAGKFTLFYSTIEQAERAFDAATDGPDALLGGDKGA